MKRNTKKQDAPSENSTYIDIILSQEEYNELTADDFLRQNDYCPYDFFDDYRAPSTTNTACTADFYESNNGIRKCESCRERWNTVCPAETEYFDDGIPAEKILKAGKEYERLVEGLEEEEQKKTDSEDDTPFDKEQLENLLSGFDESTVKCPFWKPCETLHYHEFGCVDFGCSHKKQVYDCNDVDKLSVQLEMCSGNYKECVKYAENAPEEKTESQGEWEKTHLCGNIYNEKHCEHLLYNSEKDKVLNGKKLDLYCIYCTCEDKVRKISSAAEWTGLSPKFCPKRNVTSEEASPAPMELPDTPAENAVFDYSELDSDTADRLQIITENVARVKQQYVFGMAEQVKKV